MRNLIVAVACALVLSTSLAAAQSSQAKGGPAITGETADRSKTLGASESSTNGMTRGEATVGSSMGRTTTEPSNAPIPNAAISKPPADAAAPAGR